MELSQQQTKQLATDPWGFAKHVVTMPLTPVKTPGPLEGYFDGRSFATVEPDGSLVARETEGW